MSTVARTIGIIISFAGLGLALFFGAQYFKFSTAAPAQKLEMLWEQDVQKLRAANKLPKGFDDLKEVELITPTDNAKLWIKQLQVPLKVLEKGQYKMEVLLMSFEEDNGVIGAIVQYNLVDLKTNNMIWELGRTFVLAGDPDIEKLNLTDKDATPPPNVKAPSGNRRK